MSDSIGLSTNHQSLSHGKDVSSSQATGMPFRLNGESGKLVPNPVSLFLDAQEELGSSLSGSGKLQRKDANRPERVLDNKAATVQLANAYLDANASSDIAEAGTTSEMLEKLKKHIKKETKEHEANTALDEILEQFHFDTPHDRYAALVALQQASKNDVVDSDHIVRFLNIKLAEAVGEEGATVRAGFNVSDIANKAKDLGRPSEVTQMYVDVVVKGVSIGEIYRQVKDKQMLNKADSYMNYLVGAAGDDVNSIGPSSSREKFRSAIDSVKKLQILLSMQDMCKDSESKLSMWIKPDLTKNDMFESVLNLVESQWPLVSLVQEQSLRIVKDLAQAHVAFHNQLCRLTYSIPTVVFEDDRARENLLDIVRESRDKAVAKEESEIESA